MVVHVAWPAHHQILFSFGIECLESKNKLPRIVCYDVPIKHCAGWVSTTQCTIAQRALRAAGRVKNDSAQKLLGRLGSIYMGMQLNKAVKVSVQLPIARYRKGTF